MGGRFGTVTFTFLTGQVRLTNRTSANDDDALTLTDCISDHDVIVALQTVKSDINRTLTDISVLVQTTISELAPANIHHTDMGSFPDKPFAQRLELIIDLAGNNRDLLPKANTSACHRHRILALRLPLHWPDIKFNSSPSDPHVLHLNFSRGRGLAVEIDSNCGAFLQVLQFLCQIRPRAASILAKLCTPVRVSERRRFSVLNCGTPVIT